MIKDMIEATDFRDAMALLPTAVNVITTNGPSGTHGFTASAVCSVTDTPPTLLVCMNQVVAIKPPESPSGQDESLVYFNRAYHYVGQVELV